MATNPQDVFLAKKAAKKAARRNRAPEEGKLTITSLMDIVSIIVVYLLKLYSVDPVVITPTGGQKIPLSQADGKMQDGIPIYVSSRSIVVNSKIVAAISETGDVDPAALQDNLLIGPLYDVLAEEAAKAKQLAENRNETWDGRVILVGDQTLKFSVLVQLMHTAGRAEFQEYNFCVIQKLVTAPPPTRLRTLLRRSWRRVYGR